jgi:hypothetical protein
LHARRASVACRAACGSARCTRFPAHLHGEHAGTHLHLVHFICGHHDGDVSGRARRQTAGRPGVLRGGRYSPLVETTVPPCARPRFWKFVTSRKEVRYFSYEKFIKTFVKRPRPVRDGPDRGSRRSAGPRPPVPSPPWLSRTRGRSQRWRTLFFVVGAFSRSPAGMRLTRPRG